MYVGKVLLPFAFRAAQPLSAPVRAVDVSEGNIARHLCTVSGFAREAGKAHEGGMCPDEEYAGALVFRAGSRG